MAIINKIKINDDFITLGQFLKLINVVSSGGETKQFISLNNILINDQKEDKRGKKIYKNDVIKINSQKYIIC